MLRPGGYAFVTEADGTVSREQDTFSCAHGNEIVRVAPGHQVDTPVCHRCMGRLCTKCAAEAAQTLRCIPTEQMILNMESRGRFAATSFVCAHLDRRPSPTKRQTVGERYVETTTSACRKRMGSVAIPVGTDPATVGAWCKQCGGHLCDDCAAETERTLHCPRFEAMLEDREARGRFRAALAGG